jgi:hypothetical protein
MTLDFIIAIQLHSKLGLQSLSDVGIYTMEVSVAECKGQIAAFRRDCPRNEEELAAMEMSFLGQPTGCLN